jgi:hypothetical protein
MSVSQHGGAFGLTDDYKYGRAFEQIATVPPFAGNATGTHKVGGAYIERAVSVAFKLVTNGTAGTRTGLVQYLDQSGVVFSGSAMPFTIAASKTVELIFDSGANPGGVNDGPVQITSLPGRFLQPTYSVVVSVLGGLAGDAVTNVRILLEKFSTAPEDYAPGQGGDRGDLIQELTEQAS